MIYGIGTDICCVRGIERSYYKRKTLFASEFCNTNELEQLKTALNQSTHLAKIFCAKECIGKAVGSGIVPEFWWDDIEVCLQNEKNDVFFSESGSAYVIKKLGINNPWRVHLSISNSISYVSGICIISAS